jgi:hypothetical protein
MFLGLALVVLANASVYLGIVFRNLETTHFYNINQSSIKNIYHRTSDLFKICFKKFERISGYFEEFLK